MSRHESDLHRRMATYRAQLQAAVDANDGEYATAEWFGIWCDETERLLALYKRRGE